MSAMESSSKGGAPPRIPSPPNPNKETIKQNLIMKGVIPTPKIILTLSKKHLHKSQKHHLTPSQQQQTISEETHFQTLKSEYRAFTRAIDKKRTNDKVSFIGKPWEILDRAELKELALGNREYGGEGLKTEHLRELGDILESERRKFRWLFLDDDVELDDEWVDKEEKGHNLVPPKRQRSESEAIRFLVDRLSGTELSVKDWKFADDEAVRVTVH